MATALTFLVTGATGDTGSPTARLLLSKGHRVRALVHREDERSQQLRNLGAEVHLGELDDFDAMRAALRGVHGAYFMYPVQPGIVKATAQFAQAAIEAGVKVVVNMSQIAARSDAKSWAARQHWLAERVFDWSGLNVAHIRPSLFAESLLYMAPSVRQGKLTALYAPSGRHAPIVASDQAAVIVGVLTSAQPEQHKAKVYTLHGPVEYTHPEIAALLSRVLGKPVTYTQLTKEEYLASQKTFKAYVDSDVKAEFLVQHRVEISVDHANGIFAGTNNLVEVLGGVKQSPTQLEDFLTQHRATFV